jgi:hypothetical protein
MRYSHKVIIAQSWISGEGISHTIVQTFIVHNFKLQAQQFCQSFMLPRSGQPLIHEINQTLLICLDQKFTVLQI